VRTEKRFTPTVLERFSKEGRGTGTYADYTPWHRVSRGDPSSIGRSHLIVWRDRQRELLSDQEWSGLNFAGLVPNLVDLTEQFPLSQDSSSHELSRWHVGFETNQFPGTREIAEMLGIRHPQLSSGDQSRHWTSTTDLLLVLQSERGLLELLAISCKPSEIISTRSKELLMLEKTYWAQRGVSWLLITPNQYDANVSLTLRRTSPWGYADPASQAEIDIACQVVRSEPWLPFSDVIQSITSHLGGGNHIYSAQRALWQAVWRGFLPIDLRRSWRPHHPLASVSREIFSSFNPILARRSACI
jgi:hypothetical protein